MKTILKIILIFLFSLSGIWLTNKKSNAQNVSVSFQVFYDELSPHGTWIESPEYGYVWLPNVPHGFSPYATNGYWIFTDEGWTWVSNYTWGWAPFHYGRWYNDAVYGPIWVPGNEWGPGWVTWRRSAGYYGWTPIRPGVSISVAYGNSYHVPDNQWVFVRNREFGGSNISQYYVNASSNVTIIKNSTVINNTRTDKTRKVTYNAGPDRVEVEKHVGRKITSVGIRESDKPGQELNNSKLQIYRPVVQKNNSSGKKLTPAKVGNLKDIKSSGKGEDDNSGEKAIQPVRQQPSQVDRHDNLPDGNNPSQNEIQPGKQHQKQEGHDIIQNDQKPSQKTIQPEKQNQNIDDRDKIQNKRNPSQKKETNPGKKSEDRNHPRQHAPAINNDKKDAPD